MEVAGTFAKIISLALKMSSGFSKQKIEYAPGLNKILAHLNRMHLVPTEPGSRVLCLSKTSVLTFLKISE